MRAGAIFCSALAGAQVTDCWRGEAGPGAPDLDKEAGASDSPRGAAAAIAPVAIPPGWPGRSLAADASFMTVVAEPRDGDAVVLGKLSKPGLPPNVGVSEPRWRLADVALCVEDADARAP